MQVFVSMAFDRQIGIAGPPMIHLDTDDDEYIFIDTTAVSVLQYPSAQTSTHQAITRPVPWVGAPVRTVIKTSCHTE